MEEIVMPRLSDTMERGTIARWLVHEGDAVQGRRRPRRDRDRQGDDGALRLRRGRAAAHPRAGRRDGRARRADRRRRCARRGCLGLHRRRGGRGRGGRRGRRSAEADGAAAAASATAVAAPPRERAAAAGRGDLKASPVARRIASDAGFDLRVLAGKGSGPDGRIVRVDVERALAGGTPAEPAPPAAAAAAPQPLRAAAPLPAPAPPPPRGPRPGPSSTRARCCAPSRGA